MPNIKPILIIVTNFNEIAPGEPTGHWLEEFAISYIKFKSNGFEVSVAKPLLIPAVTLHLSKRKLGLKPSNLWTRQLQYPQSNPKILMLCLFQVVMEQCLTYQKMLI